MILPILTRFDERATATIIREVKEENHENTAEKKHFTSGPLRGVVTIEKLFLFQF